MPASTAAKLYTPNLLSLATELAAYPISGEWQVQGEARSSTCGSSLKIGIILTEEDAIAGMGLGVSACAVGQAAAALFARSASGARLTSINLVLAQIEAWMEDPCAPEPDWPDFQALTAARELKGRHGAILLPWKAAQQALCKVPDTR
ncbi:MAG: iron-sulfur cluster assembly scaffold protein [Altererythrobacter sp.]|nr:iron-sulfur cluster assembly scaffold protein [Altererythrobacter sp.]